jgi:peptidyl-prolyl cis-trans isomerase SurA
MKKTTLVFALLISIVGQAQDQTLFTIGNEEVGADEFKAVYLKNRDIGKDIDPKTPREYLDLYINFKLKVKEAKELGMDTLPSFKREFGNYRKQLAQPYLEDRGVDSMLLNEAYERMQVEVNAAHIMLDLPPDALPEDTLAVYKRLMNIRSQAEKGGDFAYLARKFSTDAGSAQNGGDLGYFTVFNMVYPFETAAYTTDVGQISKPVRSQYGYHIVKVIDKRPNRGTVQVKHIFLISNEKTDSAKALAAEQRAKEIYDRLEKGEDFDQLARQFSEDKNTADKGGLLQPFGINAMMSEFEEASFGLDNPGDYSKPFKTSIGWHIVMLVEKQGIPSFEDSRRELEQKISRDSRSAKSRQVFIARLKKEYGYSFNQKRLDEITSACDESLLTGGWDATKASKYTKTLFRLDGKDFGQQEFVNYLAEQQKRGQKSKTVEQEVYKQFNAYVNKSVMNYENSKLEEKYPEFRLLVNEYRDGILLFDLTQQKVWNAASQDSAQLYAFYEANKSNYMWPVRAEADVYSCENEKVAKSVAKMAQKGSTIQEVEKKFNEESQLVVVAESAAYSKGQNKAVDKITWLNGATQVEEIDGRFYVVHIKKVLQPETRKLEDARGMVISDYQAKLEQDWIADLKNRFPVTINEEVFRSIEAELN